MITSIIIRTTQFKRDPCKLKSFHKIFQTDSGSAANKRGLLWRSQFCRSTVRRRASRRSYARGPLSWRWPLARWREGSGNSARRSRAHNRRQRLDQALGRTAVTPHLQIRTNIYLFLINTQTLMYVCILHLLRTKYVVKTRRKKLHLHES